MSLSRAFRSPPSKISWRVRSRRYFVVKAKGVRVVWAGQLPAGVGVREALVGANQWAEFATDCFLPWYKDGLDWRSPGCVNYSLLGYAKAHTERLTTRDQILLVSAYHPPTGTRLILDGCHRAVAVQNRSSRGLPIPEVRVLECFGVRVSEIFKTDFDPLLRIHAMNGKLKGHSRVPKRV